MRRWSGSSPGRGRAFAPDVDWARHAGDQHPARQYVSRRERASPSRTRARRTPALESSAPAARAASPPAALPQTASAQQKLASPPPQRQRSPSPPPSASSQPPPAAPALPPRDADERAKRRSPADTAAPRRPPSSAERRGDAELAQQRADAHELNAAMADVFISSSLARSPYRSPLRDERGVGDRSPYRSPLRERGAGYRSPLRAASPSSGQSGRENPPAQRHEAALSLEPTTSSSRQPAHWKQNSAGDGQSAYRGASPRSARARSPSPVRPAVLGQRRVDGASQAAVHLDNLLHVPPPPTLLRAAASPREHEAAELFSSPTAVRHNGVPHDPYRAAKLRMSPGRSSGPQRTSTAELLATPTPRRMSSRVLADQSGQQAGQLEHSSMHFASSSSGLAATSSTPQHPAASVRYSSRRTVSPVRSASNAAAAAALHGNGTGASWRDISSHYTPRGGAQSPTRSYSSAAPTYSVSPGRSGLRGRPSASGQSDVDKAVADAFRRARSPSPQRLAEKQEVKPAWEEGESHTASLPPFRDTLHDDRLAAAERRHGKHTLALQAAVAPDSWAQQQSHGDSALPSQPSSLVTQTQPRARSPTSRRPVPMRPATLALNADALARAVAAGDATGVTKCLEAGTNPNQVPGGTQWSFLHSAAEMKQLRIVQLLLDAGANPSLATRRGGDTPLHVVGNCAATVQALLQGGAERGLRNFRGETAADVARAAGHEDALSRLEPRLDDSSPLAPARAVGPPPPGPPKLAA